MTVDVVRRQFIKLLTANRSLGPSPVSADYRLRTGPLCCDSISSLLQLTAVSVRLQFQPITGSGPVLCVVTPSPS
ncbi:hypothetical protein J6590_096396, partial [Homalodisca vitripennis]